MKVLFKRFRESLQQRLRKKSSTEKDKNIFKKGYGVERRQEEERIPREVRREERNIKKLKENFKFK